MTDDSYGERLWRAGLLTSARFREWAELYPSIRERMGVLLDQSEGQVGAVAENLIARAEGLAAVTLGPEALRQRLGLTATESELAAALVAGESLSDYAARRSVAVQTARNQLQSIFQKTGVNRQADLVRLLLSPVRTAPDGSR